MADNNIHVTEDLSELVNKFNITAETEETEEFYSKAKKYWLAVDPTVNGVLGGYGWISDTDIRGSDKFITSIFKNKDGPQQGRALDCGAGIGRITVELLSKHFKCVDLVEQNPAFLDQAKQTLNKKKHRGNFYPCSLRDFEPTEKYDVIWCQWVLGHLTDADLVAFFQRCARALNPRGIIVVKENISLDGVIKDDEDSSVTRPVCRFKHIFKDASLQIIRQASQTNFPDGLFSVKIFALKPRIVLVPQSSSQQEPCRDPNFHDEAKFSDNIEPTATSDNSNMPELTPPPSPAYFVTVENS